jgi:hypothetical protein
MWRLVAERTKSAVYMAFQSFVQPCLLIPLKLQAPMACLLLLVLLVVSGRAVVDDWQKVLLTDAATKGAVCLDGSPGGFYYKKGSTDKWIVFHQGGGWCSSHTDCLKRAGTDLGSSKGWGPTYTDKVSK